MNEELEDLVRAFGGPVTVVRGLSLTQLRSITVSGAYLVHLVGSDTGIRALRGLTDEHALPLRDGRLHSLLSEQNPPQILLLDSCHNVEQAERLATGGRHVVGLPSRMGRGNANAFLRIWYREFTASADPVSCFDWAFEQSETHDLPDPLQPRLHGSPKEPVIIRSGGDRDVPQVRVWYGTNRALGENHEFTGEAGDGFHRGVCTVKVPKSLPVGAKRRNRRNLSGSTEVTFMGHEVLPSPGFWESIQEKVDAEESGRRTVLLYVHGYRTTFPEAAKTAAQLHMDLGVPGVTVLFSWPSAGGTRDYWSDEESIQLSERYLCRFLQEMSDHLDIDKIHVLAHSMGNRALLRVAMRAADDSVSTKGIRLGQVILAAADVGHHLFRMEASAYHELAEGVTMYVSSGDRALRSSGLVHRGHRAGFCPPYTKVPGIHVIDASRIDLSLLGHGYYAQSRPVLSDIHGILHDAHHPSARFGLRRDPESGIWHMRE
ncbi:alpha/beta hydrolase [Nocardiopsis dassonvillei]|uniref:alpha/beta hydrolase n=1 Tax=Nocardiopsis dassonvillei TaxID=2014 RepID=UPI00157C8BE0|nr:alpha/beta hydrolase [Nocardiopsis dassonvillei]